ncbi:hypothetical protein C1N91_07545 [Curtobacterium sp. SGAir0471]|uniref:hypothetical protein n=1 Tax=Curtobacterium sp. SGAir0471 TaxID=2070337 RepID=UPI0010CD2737|nr:hypothetical protein [Curtobacterium sp. SGAir0471]QCR43422.1 hypothetical protein C1N91_07545 [Curtobacterium sp. SGAir0471]
MQPDINITVDPNDPNLEQLIEDAAFYIARGSLEKRSTVVVLVSDVDGNELFKREVDVARAYDRIPFTVDGDPLMVPVGSAAAAAIASFLDQHNAELDAALEPFGYKSADVRGAWKRPLFRDEVHG